MNVPDAQAGSEAIVLRVFGVDLKQTAQENIQF